MILVVFLSIYSFSSVELITLSKPTFRSVISFHFWPCLVSFWVCIIFSIVHSQKSLIISLRVFVNRKVLAYTRFFGYFGRYKFFWFFLGSLFRFLVSSANHVNDWMIEMKSSFYFPKSCLLVSMSMSHGFLFLFVV